MVRFFVLGALHTRALTNVQQVYCNTPYMGKGNFMTAVAFAEAMDVDYTTVMRWLRNQLVPGAKQIEPIPGMTIWQIPEDALKLERPKSGPKRGAKKAVTTGGAAEAATATSSEPLQVTTPAKAARQPKVKATKKASKKGK
ncbi:MAG: hypothetical protein HOP19_21560 [Acidobacteria bacterium]|nr:hypothetical protein [Acidobacteriota bacterium]